MNIIFYMIAWCAQVQKYASNLIESLGNCNKKSRKCQNTDLQKRSSW